MDNRDWKIEKNIAEKIFFLPDEKVAENFIKKIRKLSRKEDHPIRLRRISNLEVRIRMPILVPGSYNEKEVRILNIINRLAN